MVDPAWIRQVAATGQTQVSPMLGGPGEAAHAIMLGYPIMSLENQVVGVLGLSVHLEALELALGSIPLPPGSVVTLTDQNSVSWPAASMPGSTSAGPSPLRPSAANPRTCRQR